ncbi:MAG: hypothetical protein KA233_00865 [Novosphingobium sp.]|nr:hypothetical protein [Novosphingobium sp.]MBP6554212.1 hypothetical protein [Novosphingobium sp.]
MATFRVCLIGQHQPLEIDLPFSNLGDVGVESTRAKFLIGHMTKPDEDGVCRGVLISTGRIQCVFEAD